MKAPESIEDRSAPLEQVAARWLVALQAGLSDAERHEFSAWLKEDVAHARVFAEAEGALNLLRQPRRAGQAEAALAQLALRERVRARRRRSFKIATVGLAAAAALILAFVMPTARTSREPAARTVVVRPDLQMLPDGSTVELNAGAKIEVAYTATQRSVRLVQGEALFSVAKNPSVPFVVSAGGVEVRAVGTAFVVTHGSDNVNVLVTEGRVAVAAPASADTTAPMDPVYLDAGLQVNLSLSGTASAIATTTAIAPAAQPVAISAPVPVSQPQMAAALAWREKRVEFTGTTLAEAVALFNQQNDLQIAVENQDTASLQLTGIFWSDDTEAFVRLLESGLNLECSRDGDRVVLRRR